MEEQNSSNKSNKNIGVVVVVILLIVAVAGGVIGLQAVNRSEQSSLAQSVQEQTPPQETVEEKITYKDGEYTVIGNYISPGGTEEIGVTVTLENGIITEAEVEPRATRPISKEKQADFEANYKPMVIGKKIDEVRLTKVSGSSLTPKGFNDALEKVKAQARS